MGSEGHCLGLSTDLTTPGKRQLPMQMGEVCLKLCTHCRLQIIAVIINNNNNTVIIFFHPYEENIMRLPLVFTSLAQQSLRNQQEISICQRLGRRIHCYLAQQFHALKTSLIMSSTLTKTSTISFKWLNSVNKCREQLKHWWCYPMCYREAHNYPQSTAAFFRDVGHQSIGWTQNSQVSRQIIGSSIPEGTFTFTPFLDTTKSRTKDLELKFKHSCFVRNEYVISKSTLSKKTAPSPQVLWTCSKPGTSLYRNCASLNGFLNCCTSQHVNIAYKNVYIHIISTRMTKFCVKDLLLGENFRFRIPWLGRIIPPLVGHSLNPSNNSAKWRPSCYVANLYISQMVWNLNCVFANRRIW